MTCGRATSNWTLRRGPGDTCRQPLAGCQGSGRAPSAAALLADAVGYVFGNIPLWEEKTLYRADRYAFHTHLGGLQRPRTGADVSRFAELSAQ